MQQQFDLRLVQACRLVSCVLETRDLSPDYPAEQARSRLCYGRFICVQRHTVSVVIQFFIHLFYMYWKLLYLDCVLFLCTCLHGLDSVLMFYLCA